MTREETISHLCSVGGFDTSYSYQNMVSCVEQLFDYFENRTCENCKHKNEDGLMEYSCFECKRYYSDRWESKK